MAVPKKIKIGFIKVRAKPPHESLKNTIFQDIMQGFWLRVKAVAVFEEYFESINIFSIFKAFNFVVRRSRGTELCSIPQSVSY